MIREEMWYLVPSVLPSDSVNSARFNFSSAKRLQRLLSDQIQFPRPRCLNTRTLCFPCFSVEACSQPDWTHAAF